MMTLEEAIKHCKDVALSCTDKECALEHFQVLKWLQEYSNMLEKQCEQNPIDKVELKWSEEDERIMNFCISRIQDELEALRNNNFAHQEILQDLKEGCWERIDWLESIKQRMEE